MHYVTERAVFELRPEGLTLTEIAPGIDIQTQVLDLMEFTPRISPDLKGMDTAIFLGEITPLPDFQPVFPMVCTSSSGRSG